MPIHKHLSLFEVFLWFCKASQRLLFYLIIKGFEIFICIDFCGTYDILFDDFDDPLFDKTCKKLVLFSSDESFRLIIVELILSRLEVKHDS